MSLELVTIRQARRWRGRLFVTKRKYAFVVIDRPQYFYFSSSLVKSWDAL
jgi:hypothetical protein